MDVYGNKTWNNATDNRDKSIVPMADDTFKKFQEQLENSGINYFAYSKDSKTVMAVNDKDLNWFKSIIGKDADKMKIHKSDVVYTPPAKNIIGNAEYRYIPQKEYISLDTDTALKMAELMEKQNIQFSGRVSANGKTTLTVSQPDLSKVKDIQNSVIQMRKQFAKDEKADEIIGNKAYRDIRSKHYFHSKMKPEEYKEIQPFLGESAEYSGLIRNGKVIFTVEEDNSYDFYMALESAQREAEIYRDFADSGLSKGHIEQLGDIIHKTAAEDVHISLDNFFNERYSDEQFSQMIELTESYLAQSPIERISRYSVLEDMLKAKNDFDRSIEMTDYFSEHTYNDDQKALITEMFMNNEPRSFIDAIDETFTPNDIQKFNELLHNHKNVSDVTDFLENHRQAEPAKSKKLYDVFIYDGESKTSEPIRCEADNEREARKIGETYIHQWNLLDAEITDIQEVQPEHEKIIESLTMHKVGNFYEMYGENAKIGADILDISITSKNGDSMIGFPDFKKDDYADKLKNASYDVVIEEISDLDKAKKYINDFCIDEYSSEADFSDISAVSIAYTTDEETELPIQVTADLEKYRMIYEYGGNVVRDEQYNSLAEMNENVLSVLDFNDLIALSDEEKAIDEKSQESVKMTVYHGTLLDFNTFKPDYRGAIWTETDFDKAKNYSGNMPESKVLTCETELKSPAHFTFGTAENWDIDGTIHEAMSDGHDSAIIDFKFQAKDNDFYKFALERYPDEEARRILSSIKGASSDDAFEGETISQFAQRMTSCLD